MKFRTSLTRIQPRTRLVWSRRSEAAPAFAHRHRSEHMKKPMTPTEPLFFDKQAEVCDLATAFVTRTTLRSILHRLGANSLEDLDIRSCASPPGQPAASDTTVEQ